MVAPGAAAAATPLLEWKEVEDEAHSADCVTVDVPLPEHVTAKDLRVELHLRTLRVRAKGEVVFEDRFAEEGWLSLEESYWEFVPEGPVLRYFLLKNAEFQREPLYCLFETELFDKGEGAEELAEPSNDTGEDDDESIEDDDKKMHDAPVAMNAEATHAHGDESAVAQSEGQAECARERLAAADLQEAEGPPVTIDAASEAVTSVVDIDTVAADASCPVDRDQGVREAEATAPPETPGVERPVDEGPAVALPAVASASCPRFGDNESCEADSSTPADKPDKENETDGASARKTVEQEHKRGSQQLAGAIQQAVVAAGQDELLHKKLLSICIMASSTGDSEALEDFDSLRQVGSAELRVAILGFQQTTGSQSCGTPGISIHRLYGRRDYASILQECGDIDIVYVPSGLLESWYYYSASFVRSLAAKGSLVIAARPLNARPCDTSMAATESILTGLGCKISVPCCQSQGWETGKLETFCCAQGLVNGASLSQVPSVDADAVHKWYLSLRRMLAGQGIDFRPLYPAPDVADKACAAAQAAHRAWKAVGASADEASVAAGISAGEYQLAAMTESGQYGPSCIQAAVAAAVRGAVEVGAAEFRAAAVGALLGLREGLFVWDRSRPLEAHGADVANIVGTTLAAEGLWKSFPEDIRRRKIFELINAGGLRRPGECTIALCQALLGVNRPKGGSRLVAASSILRKVSEILLVAASLPNLLDASGSEVSTFSAIVMECVNAPRLSKLLTDTVD